MEVLSPTSKDRCRPVRIVSAADVADGYLGGSAPEGAVPSGLAAPMRYFATVPLASNPASFVSIFVLDDLEALMKVRGHLNALGPVRVRVHGEARRATAREHESTLSACGLLVLPETADRMPDDDGERLVLSGHKIGGRPHLIRETPELRRECEQLFAEGFFQACQIDFPDAEDAKVSGDWTFADGIFSLFARPPFEENDWRWYWDF